MGLKALGGGEGVLNGSGVFLSPGVVLSRGGGRSGDGVALSSLLTRPKVGTSSMTLSHLGLVSNNGDVGEVVKEEDR